MAEPYNRKDRGWRRFDEAEDFENRPGALDRKWGYGDRLTPKGGQNITLGRRNDQEDEYEDEYDAIYYWANQKAYSAPGPYTGIGPRGYRRSDERIQEDVCMRLAQHGQIDARDIQVNVEQGQVTLTGTVDNRRMKRITEAAVDAIPGVVDVHNRLHINKRES